MKICSKCKVELSVDKFGKDKSSKDGLVCYCRDCRIVIEKKYRTENADKKKETCKKYYENNKQKESARKKKYAKENPEILQKRKRKYTIENPDKIKETSKKYYEENLERITIRNAQWRINNRDKASRIKQRRRTRQNLGECTLTTQEWESIKQYFDNECCYCGRKSKLSQEHFVPVSKHGDYSLGNILCACRSCNSSKLNLDFNIWYPRYKYYSGEREDKIIKYLSANSTKVILAI